MIDADRALSRTLESVVACMSGPVLAVRGCGTKGKHTMSATIPLPARTPSAPHELFASAWAAQAATPAPPSGLASFLAAWRRWMRDTWAGWRDRRAIYATQVALMKLDDQTLRDIGLMRAEIESVAAETHGGVAATRSRLLERGGPPAH